MSKKDKDETQDNGSIGALIAAFAQFKEDVGARFDELEQGKDASGQAKLYIAQMLFNPDSKHLSEMSNNPLRTIRPLADAVTAGSILDDDVQSGEKTLGEKWRESYHTNMRGLRGNLMEKAKELALEQVKGEREEAPYEESSLGKGL